jgi:VanZ family protein
MILLLRLALALNLVVISWLALVPTPIDLGAVLWTDKVQHFMAFWVLSCCVDLAFPRHRFLLWKFAPLVLYGVAIELVQSQVPGRDASWLDLLTDVSAIALYWLTRHMVRRVFLRLVEIKQGR